MTAVIVALCLGTAFGWALRSESARAEAGRWRARCNDLRARLRDVHGELDWWRAKARADAERTLRKRLGPDAWLLYALDAVHREMRPGEEAENLTVQCRWRDTTDEVVLGIDRGEMLPERALRIPATMADDDGYAVDGWAYEEIDIPEPGHKAWRER